jgi:hypothetical protein
LAAVAHQLAAKGQYDQALEVAKTIKDDTVKTDCLEGAQLLYKITVSIKGKI